MLKLFKKVNIFRFLANLWFFQKEPVSLVHFVTNRCNARCSFCFIDFEDENIFNDELSIQEIDILTKSLGRSLVNVNLTGGEPFARKDLVEVARKYCKNTTIQSIYITTNGSLPDRIEKFTKIITKEFPYITLTISISIDGLEKDHDRIRKISGLYQNCIKSYNLIRNLPRVEPVVNITVSHDNYKILSKLYNHLTVKNSIRSIKATIVRDEGVYKIPAEHKKQILDGYVWLTNKIIEDSKKNQLDTYNQNTIQGRMHLTKDKMSYKYIAQAYMNPFYQSLCPAGKLFGIIDSKGRVFACEILEKDLIGQLRKNKLNFMKVWNNKTNRDLRKKIKYNNCNCTYECALSYNFISNMKYQPVFIKSFLNF